MPVTIARVTSAIRQGAQTSMEATLDRVIFPLDHPDLTLAVAGGKGLSLHQMARAGFPVPPGFVIGTSAYRGFVEIHQLQPRIADLSRQTTPGNVASFERASAEIRQLFDQGEIPAAVAEAIRRAYVALSGPVAVRSSATAEDLPEASFAGQQETYLNVVGEELLLAAVRRCWSSLWTARAIAYRVQRDIALSDIALAVVVQQMVPAEVAGVLFTLNPVTGHPGEVLINATWGLGEALVSGQVNPDTVLVDKATGRVKEVHLGDKAVMTAATADGTAEVAVPPAQRQRQALTPSQAADLARWGRSLEAHFGAPQDIEWAIAQDTIYLLQSRPVTAVAASATPGDDHWPPFSPAGPQPYDLWTQADLGERWPEPVTPLTWSTGYAMIRDPMMVSFGGIPDPYLREIEWARRAYGHVYLNEGAITYAVSRSFGMPASSASAALAHPEAIPADQNRYRWGTLLRRLPRLVRMARSWERNLPLYERAFSQIDRWVEEFMARDLSEVGDAELWREGEDIWRARLMHFVTYHAQVTSMGTSSYGFMESFLEKTMGRKELTQELVSGLSDIIAAEIVPTLWQIAQKLRELGLDPIVRDHEPKAALAQLRQLPSAQPMISLLEAFLRRHGHRCMSEAEWRYPRWREAPEQVIEAVAGYLRAGMASDPAEMEGQPRWRREEATAQVEAKLDPLRRAYFRFALKRLHRLIRLRDNGQHFLVKLLLPMRRIYATLAERWAEHGWLAQPEDLFFLVVPEIEAVLHAGHPSATGLDLKAITAGRRAAYAYWLTQPMPDMLGPDGLPLETAAPADGSTLTGIAVSQGQVQGVARVILSPRETTRLQPGEILVTRATDPGWTPVFSVIGGLVLEIGGQLSHGAIVSREYGLPAVVNVVGATQCIRDGQVIRVDGGSGRVHLSP